MQDFTKRRGRGQLVRRFLLGICLLVLLGVVTFAAVRASWNMYGKFAEATASNDAAQKNLAQLKDQKSSVEEEVASLSSPQGQEALLRRSYGVARPGEGVIQIVHESATSSSPQKDEGGNFFMRILRALFVW
jgi:cell division protein FtsB